MDETVSIAQLNQLHTDGIAEAQLVEDTLADTYRDVLLDAERGVRESLAGASAALTATLWSPGKALTAASDWTIPDVDEVYDRLKVVADAQRRTEGLREEVVRASMTGILTSFGVSFDVANPLVGQLLAEQGTHIVGIVEEHRQQIMQVLTDAWEAGASIPQAAQAVLDTGIDRTTSMAQTIARTEVVGASNGGSLLAVLMTDAAPYKQWLTASGAPNPRHNDAGQYPELVHQVVRSHQLFQVGGSLMRYPGDPSGAAKDRINCRCTLVYAPTINGLEGIFAGGQPMADEPTATEEAPAEVATGGWQSPALFQVETLTRDARMIAADALGWSTPMPLMMQDGDVHDAWGSPPPSQNAGEISSVAMEGNNAVATGSFDDTPAGQRAAELAGTGRYGISVDLAVQEYEIVFNADGFDPWWDMPIPTDAPPVGESVAQAEVDAAHAADEFADEDGYGGWYKVPINIENEVMRITRGEVMGATMVPFAAFKDATITVTGLAADGSPTRVRVLAPIRVVQSMQADGRFTPETRGMVIDLASARLDTQDRIDQAAFIVTASGAGMAPVNPPSKWFTTPDLDTLTPLTVTDEGEVYGHIAGWGTCHTGYPERCVTPPTSEDDYSLFHLGEVKCDDGTRVAVGKITAGGPHADLRLDWQAAAAHYDTTGWAAADVRVGNDAHGVWCHGALRPGITAEQAREFMASVPSGDWRPASPKANTIKLMAILAVNVPGFPVVRANVASGMGDSPARTLALVSAGVVARPRVSAGLSGPERTARLAVLHARASGGLDGLHKLARG